MIHTNVTYFRKNMFQMLDRTIRFGKRIRIATQSGNAIVISEEDYNGIKETLYLMSIPGMTETILEGMRTPVSELIPEEKVEW